MTGIIKIDRNGEEVWRRDYPDLTHHIYFRAIIRTSEMGFAVAGDYAGVNNIGSWHRPFAVRLGADGSERWHAVYEVDNMDGFRVVVNEFQSLVAGQNGELIAAGSIYTAERDSTVDGLLIKLEPNMLGPRAIRTQPEDTLFSALIGCEYEFMAVAESCFPQDLTYEWMYDDSANVWNIGVLHDTLAIVQFDSLGVHLVECRIADPDATVSVRWHVTVSDLFIASYSPDTLSLSLRRGTSQTFSLDTVRAVEGDPVQYQWTLTNLDNFEREETGAGASATVEFLRSGNYQMEGLAYRGESSDNVIWTIAVRSAILDFWPRELNLSVPPDSSGEFGVIPFNPDSDSLSYRWEVDGDSVGSDSTVTLRFAWDGQAGRITYAVSAIVMDGAEGDTVRWEVFVQDPNTTPPTPPSIEGGEIPATFGIVSISPNPFNNYTTIRFTVPFGSESAQSAKSAVRLTVHDLMGREVARLVDERAQQAGPYAVTFNGSELPAGMYLVRLQAGERQQVAKIVLVR